MWREVVGRKCVGISVGAPGLIMFGMWVSDKSGSPQGLNWTLSPTLRFYWKMLCFLNSC